MQIGKQGGVADHGTGTRYGVRIDKRLVTLTWICEASVGIDRNMRGDDHELVVVLTGLKFVLEPIETGLVKAARA